MSHSYRLKVDENPSNIQQNIHNNAINLYFIDEADSLILTFFEYETESPWLRQRPFCSHLNNKHFNRIWYIDAILFIIPRKSFQINGMLLPKWLVSNKQPYKIHLYHSHCIDNEMAKLNMSNNNNNAVGFTSLWSDYWYRMDRAIFFPCRLHNRQQTLQWPNSLTKLMSSFQCCMRFLCNQCEKQVTWFIRRDWSLSLWKFCCPKRVALFLSAN